MMNFLPALILLLSAITYFIEIAEEKSLVFNTIYFITTSILFVVLLVVGIVTL